MPPNRRPDWQELWERLRKLGIELDENRRNGIVEAHERLYNSTPVGWRSALERYIEREVGLHVHLIKRREPGTAYHAAEWCATFEWPASVTLADSEIGHWLGTSSVVQSDKGTSEVNVAVLVDVPEFIKNRKRLFGRILPVVKRLQPLEVCAQTWRDSPEALKVFGRIPRDDVPTGVRRVGVDVNRETDGSPLTSRSALGNRIRRRDMPHGKSELPNKVVKRGAEVVNNVSDDSAPFLHGWFPEGIGVEEYLACLRARLGFEFVGVAIGEPLNSLVQEVQVHIRPINFRPTPVQGIIAMRYEKADLIDRVLEKIREEED